MDTTTAEEVRARFMELSDVLSNRDLIATLERARKDEQLVQQIEKDPKGYFQKNGIQLPPDANVTVDKLQGMKVTYKVCVDITYKVGDGWFEVHAHVCVESD